mmetsp:Transcript_16316/g.49066  ORF Transcript_16316/g.49066 Transcript_16316/m.49066 type:complete len:217 (-) Transcript_16316:876-1526(-)
MFVSLSAIRSSRPSPGLLMSFFRPVIAVRSCPRDLDRSSTRPLLSSRSLLHQPSCSLSALPSSTISFSMFLIWSRTSSKGFSASREARTFTSLSDDLSLAHALWRSAWACVLASPSDSCLRIWRKLVAPVVEASFLPKVSKAESLLRMATASETAASSLARIAVRSLYCIAFALHIGTSSARKASSVARSFLASFSVSFLEPRLASLEPRVRCFFL